MIRVISDVDVQTHILPHMTLASLLRSQALAFRCLIPRPSSSPDSETAQCPTRLSLSTPRYTQLFMPARTTTSDSVVKIVAVPKAGVGSGIPGVNVLFDDQTGMVSHVVNSTCLTALRTAAGSLLSSIVSLGADGVKQAVRNVVVFGDGAQAVLHVWLHLRYFTSIHHVTVVTGLHRTLTETELETKQRGFEKQLGGLGATPPSMLFVNAQPHPEKVRSAVEKADLIFTCTPSTTPLFAADYVANGPERRHVCAVGSYKPHMCELAPELVRQAASDATLLVDSKAACGQEAGCLLQALPPSQVEENCVELGTLLADAGVEAQDEGEWMKNLEETAQGWKGGRMSVFKSVGVGLQDVEVTKLVVRLAGADNIGSSVPF